MSITSNPQQIRDNPLNTSTSNCNEAYYNLSEARSKRAAGLGYGTRSDFTKLGTGSPPPNAYQLKSAFDNNPAKIGPTFGLGRAELASAGIIQKKPGPGPCNYQLPSQLSKISYTIGQRTPINNSMTFLKDPGPGTYKPIETLSQTGKYFVSNFANSKASLFNPVRSQRFQSFNGSQTPGPGQYKPKTDLQVGGQYIISKYKSSGGKSFPHSMRSQQILNSYLNPGPGTYRLPSDFGYYEVNKNSKQ